MQPVARFLLGDGSRESQLQALERIAWCNIVSCCPAPDHHGEVPPASAPTAVMRRNCVQRLVYGDDHELFRRVVSFQPTHILVLGGAAKSLWERAARSGTALAKLLERSPRPRVAFAWHPSQRRSRLKYWEHVYTQLLA